jgi:hypothetical protein
METVSLRRVFDNLLLPRKRGFPEGYVVRPFRRSELQRRKDTQRGQVYSPVEQKEIGPK